MNRTISAAIIVITGGLFAGWVDMNNNEVQAAVIVLLGIAGVAGMVQPNRAWRWGVIAGSGVPTAYCFARMFHLPFGEWPQPDVFASLLAIIPATLGAYCGALAGNTLWKRRPAA